MIVIPNLLQMTCLCGVLRAESCLASMTATRRGQFGDLADWSGPALEA